MHREISGSAKVALSVFLVTVVSLALLMHGRVSERGLSDKRTDIRAQFEDAVLLSKGVNPYSRISNPDLPQDRFTFYFPGFLLASTAAVLLGADTYPDWMQGWRVVSLLVHISIGVLLLFFLLRFTHPGAAIIGSAFWFTSRWPLALYRGGQIDGPAILFLLASLFVLSSRKHTAYLLFGLSLAVKQMGAFLFPLYLIWAWQDADSGKEMRSVLKAAVLCLLIPGLLCLPFFIWDPADFVKMTLFPLSREATEPLPYHAFLGLEGVKRKIPFFGLLALIYFECTKDRLTRVQQVTLVLFALLSFTNTYFSRHFNWLLPFLVLVATQMCATASEKRQAP